LYFERPSYSVAKGSTRKRKGFFQPGLEISIKKGHIEKPLRERNC
jgi:hypothetical protein